MKEDDSRFQKELRPQLYVDDSLELFADLREIREEKQLFSEQVSWFGLGTQFFLIGSDIQEKESYVVKPKSRENMTIQSFPPQTKISDVFRVFYSRFLISICVDSSLSTTFVFLRIA